MKKASVAELKAKLSECLARAKAGEEVIVTERGKPVAKLVPVDKQEAMSARIQELYRSGQLIPPKRKATPEFWAEFRKRPRGEDPEGLLLKALLEEREEGW